METGPNQLWKHVMRKGISGGSGGVFFRSAILFCALAALNAAAMGGEGSGQGASGPDETILFEEIPTVYGASKYDQKASEAPASVSVVTGEEIRRFGLRTLADVVRRARGFYATNDRNYTYLGVRGINCPGDYNTRVLALVDGFRVNDPVYGQATMGREFPVDVALIDRVEIIRGPSSSIYGTNAFFAVVNVITKRGRDVAGVELSSEAGSFESFGGRAVHGFKTKSGWEGLVSASVFDSAGQSLFFPEFADVNGGVSRGADFERTRRFFGSLSYGDFQFEARHASRRKGVPTASYGTVFGDPGTSTVDESTHFGVQYRRRTGGGSDWTGRVYIDHSDYRGDYVYDHAEEGEPVLGVNRDRGRGARWGGELTWTRQLARRHLFTLGTEFRNNFRLRQENFNSPNPPSEQSVSLSEERSSMMWGFYAQDEFRLSESVLLNVGLRADYDGFVQDYWNASPRLGLIYAPSPKTNLKLLYGEAFRAPNAFELYYDDNGQSQKAALNLKPEKIRTGELSLDRYVGNHLLVSGSVYHFRVRQMISLCTDKEDQLLVFANQDALRGWGVEAGLEAKASSGLEARVSASVQKAEAVGADGDLVNSPRLMSKMSLAVPLFDQRLFAALDALYLSGRNTLGGGRADSHFLLHATVFAARLASDWELSASVYNLFDQRYADPGSEEHTQDLIPQDGRTFRFTITRHFSVK